MIDKQTGELLGKFRNDWRAAGWWADAEQSAIKARPGFYAGLFSPEALKEILDEDFAERQAFYESLDTYQRPQQRPKRRTLPPVDVIFNSPNMVFAPTAQQACIGAIVTARALYSETPKNPLELSELIKQRATRRQGQRLVTPAQTAPQPTTSVPFS